MIFYMSEKKSNKSVKTTQHRGNLLKQNMLRRKEQQKNRNTDNLKKD